MKRVTELKRATEHGGVDLARKPTPEVHESLRLMSRASINLINRIFEGSYRILTFFIYTERKFDKFWSDPSTVDVGALMSTELRAQGRPPRGDGEVGRSKLVDRTRNALKSRPKLDIQRREVASFAGVTPALVSYYYPDKWDLFAAAARPVITAYIVELRAILQLEDTFRTKILQLALLYVDFNFHQGYLLDFYMENSNKMARKEDLDELKLIYREVIMFFESLLEAGLVRGDNPSFLQSSLWGWCKYIAQQPHLALISDSSEKDRILRKMAENVCDLFLNGAAAQRSDIEESANDPRQNTFETA